MAMSLDGKTAIVTSAPQSAGRAIAQKLLDAGANVMLADTEERAAAADAEPLLSGDEERYASFLYSGLDRLGIANLVAATVDRFERIDILVNAAQTSAGPGAFMDLAVEDFDAALGEGVGSVFQLSQVVAKRMLQQAGESNEGEIGTIVNISSIAATRTVPELLAYSVACAALEQLTRSMATSLAPRGIRVNAVALGGVMTERLRSAFREDEHLREEMLKVTPLGRLAEMEEAAEAALFLASGHASYITGQVVSVDGGRTLLDPLASPIR